eukprot:m.127687 g.127687  ORF g.127687 m.127687 type:complete len:1185 (-) comp29294_c0_seq3:434-3988(-)
MMWATLLTFVTLSTTLQSHIMVDAQALTRCVGANTDGTTGPIEACSCATSGLSNCRTCLFDTDGDLSLSSCEVCVGGMYLHNGVCHSSCGSFPWTIEAGSESFNRVCEPIGDLVTVIDCGPDSVASRCRPRAKYGDVGGCELTAEFDVTPSSLGNVATLGGNAVICAAHTDCEPSGLVQVVAPTPTTDRTCGLSTSCFVGEYEESAATPTSTQVCTGLKKCNRGTTYETQAPTPTTNRVCELGTVCELGSFFEVVPMTLTTDRECESTTVCNTEWVEADVEELHAGVIIRGEDAAVPAQEYLIAQPTLTSDRQCQPLTQCDFCIDFSNATESDICEYQSVQPTPTSDAQCSPITTCRLPFETVSLDATLWTDRVCQVPSFYNVAQFDVVVKAGEQILTLPAEELLDVRELVQAAISAQLSLDADLFRLFAQLDGDTARISVNLPTYDHVLSIREYMPSLGMPFLSKGFLVYVPDTFDPPETVSPSTSPTMLPTSSSPTANPTSMPSVRPTLSPTVSTPTTSPTRSPSSFPTTMPTTPVPSAFPTAYPSEKPTVAPSVPPTAVPTMAPSTIPTKLPTTRIAPSSSPTTLPTALPTLSPSEVPSESPTTQPTQQPTRHPTVVPSANPTNKPTNQPSASPTDVPSQPPTRLPTHTPTNSPTSPPTSLPTALPSTNPSANPTRAPSLTPSMGAQASILDNAATTAGVGLAAAIVLLLIMVLLVQLTKAKSRRKDKSNITIVENGAHESFVDPVFPSPKKEIVEENETVETSYNVPIETNIYRDAPAHPDIEARSAPISLAMVGSRVSVLGFGNGTLRYYGRHAFQPGFRCGVELDDMIGYNNGSVDGYYYFSCKDKYGVLVDPRKIGSTDQVEAQASFVEVCYGGEGGEVGNVAEATGNAKDQQLMSLQDQKDMALATYQGLWRKKPDELYTHARNNVARNRYLDILPYDGTRVTLSDNNGQTYINGNYVNFYSENRALNTICCQGPMSKTVTDLWAMVWEQNANIVVMLTGLVEGNREKCSRYWPNALGESVTFGEYKVSWDAEVSSVGSTTVLKLLVSRNEQGRWSQARAVHHVQFAGWPDHGVPDRPADFMQMIQVVHNLQDTNQLNGVDAPTVVHCSAGVGRTGVFLLVNVLLDKLKQKIVPDVSAVLTELRKQRMLLVQMPQQFVFVFEALLWALNHRSWAYY